MKLIIILTFFFTTQVFANTTFLERVTNLIKVDPEFNKVQNLYEYQKSVKTGSQTKLFLPDLSLDIAKSKAESVFSNTETESTTSSLNLKYNLFSFGSDFLNYQSQKKYLAAYKEELTQTTIKKEKDIITLLLSKVKILKSLHIQKEIIILKEKTYKISQKKYKRGSLSKNDLIKVKLDLTNTKSELISLKQQLFTYNAQLQAYGNPPEVLSFPWINLFQSHGISKLESLELNIDKNPNILRYKLLADASESEATGTKRGHLGRVSFNYSRDLYQVEDNPDLYGWSTSIVYTLPLFENFDQDASIQRAKANARTAQVAYQYNKRLIQSQATLKKDFLQLTLQNFKDRMAVLKDLDLLYRNVENRYRKGVLSVNELFIEQDRLLTSKNLTNSAIYNIHLSYLDYLHTHGVAVTKNTGYL